MIIYKRYMDNPMNGESAKYIQRLSDGAVIPFEPANTDYQTFKSQINADEAQLEDADGVLMSPDAAVAFISNLP